MVTRNPYSHHPTLDPNPDCGQRLKRAGLDHEHWTSADDRRFAELTRERTRCDCGAFMAHWHALSIHVLPLDDPDWPMITFELKKQCNRCGKVITQYT